MTIIWLIVWLCESTPSLSFDPLNAWVVSLAVCAFIDVMVVTKNE